MIEFLALISYPALLIGGLWFLHWYSSTTYNSPEVTAQREKADYERAHAYTKGKCCCGKD